MTSDFDEASFARVAITLRAYLGDIVFVGGWACRLFRLHPLALVPAFSPLMTRDVDIAAPVRLQRRSQTLRQLLIDASFKELPSGDNDPPRTEYRLDDEGSAYVQFITPLTGSEHHRDGTPDATTRIQGVTAEKLRHIDLLLTAPWTVELTAATGYPVGLAPLPIKVCNPVSYLAQKVLSLPKRRSARRGKDVLYIHDTLLLFGGAFEDLREIWSASVQPNLDKRAFREVTQAPERLFGNATDAARDAAVQARSTRGRTIRVDDLVAVCRRGLSEIFTG